MATAFGGARPIQAYVIRVRYLVVSLVLTILVLIGTLVATLTINTQSEKLESSPLIAGTIAASRPQLEIAVVTERLEEGAQLEKRLLRPMPWEPSNLPERAILWKDVDQTIIGRYSARMISANMPLTLDAVTDEVQKMSIPEGFRAVSISVDARQAVETWARPHSRVDVTLIYNDPKDNTRKAATVLQGVKVLSVSGDPNPNAANIPLSGTRTVTLLVAEEETNKLELARASGELSLALLGTKQVLTASRPTAPVTLGSLFETPEVPETPVYSSVVTTTDPRSGRQVSLGLSPRGWVKITTEDASTQRFRSNTGLSNQ